MPRSSARGMASTDSWSSCAPQANCHPPPPMAHAPTPMGVISRSLAPSLFFCIPLSCQEHVSLVSHVFLVFLVFPVFLSCSYSGIRALGGRAAPPRISLDDAADCLCESPDVGRLLDELPCSQFQRPHAIGVM